jgi:methyl-accepting chemotaxis protein
MSHTMEHRDTMNQTKIRNMSKMMNDISVAMKEMSEHMEHMVQGKMDAAMMKKMEERIKEINQRMEKMEKAGK